MAVAFTERPDQRITLQYRKPSVVRKWVARNEYDKLQVQLAVAADLPATDFAIDSQTQEPIPVYRDDVRIHEMGGGVWEVEVTYNSSPNTKELAIDFGLENIQVYQALETVVSYDCINGGSNPGPGDWGAVPGFKGAIGVNGDEVKGVTIEGGAVRITVTMKRKRAAIPTDYMQVMADFMTPYTAINHDTYTIFWLGQTLTFPAKTLRFRGGNVKGNSDSEVEITHNFAYQKGIAATDNFTVNASDAIAKSGWDVLWIYYGQSVSNGNAVQEAKAAIINRVYPLKNFAELDV